MLRAVRIAMLTAATALACTAARAGAATPNDTYVSYLEIAREPENAEALPAPQPVPGEPQPTDWIDWNGENFFSPCSGDCSISLSGGRQIRTSMTRIVTLQKPAWEWNWGHSELLAGAFSRRLVTFWNALNIEPEFGVAKRLGDMQAVEFWGAVTVRWTAFPWNDYIKTTIAFSDGFSLATQVDTVERNANVNHAGSILLNYFTAAPGTVAARRAGQGSQAGRAADPGQVRYVPDTVPENSPYNIAQLYAKLGESIRIGTPVSPGFDAAVRRHHLIDAIVCASRTGQKQSGG